MGATMTSTESPAAVDLIRQRLAVLDPAAADVLAGPAAAALGERPDDPALLRNALCPGAWPIEVSFAESEPETVRADFCPLPPAEPPERHLAAALDGIDPGEWGPAVAPRRFGAFVALAAPPRRRRAYLELSGGHLPAPYHALVAGLGAYVPGLRPHLVSLPGTPRLYLDCTRGLALLSLMDWAAGHGLAPAMPALIDAVRRLTGGCLILPESSLLLAIRPLRTGIELKVEITRQALAPDAADIVARLLLDRPAAHRAYQRWRAAFPEDLSVVSVRVPGPRLNVYAALGGRR
jgi:hypothetical protein